MSALRLGRPDAFHKLGNQGLTPQEAIQLLSDDLKLERVEWWFTLFATGGGIALKDGQKVLDAMKEAGLADKDADPLRNQFGQWAEGWGHSWENRFAQTHQKIEKIMQW